MNILITGGAGYIGTSLIPLLLEANHRVTVFDNLLFGGDPLLLFFRNPNFFFVKGDVRDKDALQEAVRTHDVIVHLAAIVGYPACRIHPQLAQSVNVEATKTLSSLLSRDQLVIYASTHSNYGAAEEICTEETPLNPLTLYGETKTIAETLLLESNTTVAYRFATAFGVSPRLRLDLLVNDFTYKMLTQGYLVVYEKHFMRTFIHVHDMARAVLLAVENADKMKREVFNVGSEDMNYSKEEICEIIKKKTNGYVHYADIGEDADKRNYVVSYDKIGKLRYKTTLCVEEGVDELVKALRSIEYKIPYANV